MTAQTFRQVLITIGLTLCNVSDGFIFGQMSGMLDALNRENGKLKLTEDEAALIAAIINVTCICGFAVLGVTTEVFGRRRAVTILTLPVVISWVVIYYVQDKTLLLVTRVVVGISYGGILVLTKICIGEYKSPSNRSLYLNIVASVGQLSGTTIGHLLSLALNWRHVALIGLVPSTLSCIIPLFWVESPSWLASKGRFEECEKAFKLLHVMDEDNTKELKLLISLEKEKQNIVDMDRTFTAPLRKVLWACKQKYLWNVILMSLVINIYRVVAGRVLFSSLALTIFRDFTGYSNLWGITLLVDGLGVIGALISCVLVSLFKRLRNLLFSFGVMGNCTLLLISVICYFSRNINTDDNVAWTKASLLALYFVIVNSGAYPVLEALLSEIYPLEAKTFCIFVVGVITGIIQFLFIKFAPYLFRNLGYDGTFFVYAIIIFLCLAYLWKFMPETKGKTLQDIEIHFKKEFFKTERADDDAGSHSVMKN